MKMPALIQKKMILKCLPFALAAMFPLNASASWGAWGEDVGIRGEGFQKMMQQASTEAEVAAKAGIGSNVKDAPSVANYVTSSLFKSGNKSYKVQAVSRLTRTPVSEHLVHYEAQPLIADFKNGAAGELSLAFPLGARKMTVDRDPENERLSGGNLPSYMIESGNQAVAESEKPLTIDKLTYAYWEQSIKLNLEGLGDGIAKSDPTQFKVSRLADGSFLMNYAVKQIEFDVKDGRVTLAARGFSVVDGDFNLVFVSGLAYDGMMVMPSGESVPIRGRRIVNAQGVGFDVASINGLPQRIKEDFSELSDKVEPYEAEKNDNLNEIYAQIDPAIAMWDADSQAIAEHRSNIAPLVAYAAWAAFDSVATIATNTYGSVTGNARLAAWNGPTAMAVQYATSGAIDFAGGNSTTSYFGKTAGEWAAEATNVAMSVASLTGEAKVALAAGREAVAVLRADAVATNITSDINTVQAFVKDVTGALNYTAPSADSKISPTLVLRPVTGFMATGNQIDMTSGSVNLPNNKGGISNAALASLSADQLAAVLTPSLSATPILTDNFISATPIYQTGVVGSIPGGGGTYYGAGTPSGPTILIASEAISFSRNPPAIMASGVLSPLSGINLTYYPQNVTASFGQNGANFARVEFGNVGLQYSNFGTIWLLPAKFYAGGNPVYTPGVPQLNVAYAGGSVLTTAMPTIGSATYFGSLIGVGQTVLISGSAMLSVNFSSGGLTGNFNYTNTGYINGSVNMTATITGNSFKGTVSSAAGQVGVATGHFYGPSANEITGAFNLTGPNTVNSVGSPNPAFNITALGGGPTMTVVASFGVKKQ